MHIPERHIIYKTPWYNFLKNDQIEIDPEYVTYNGDQWRILRFIKEIYIDEITAYYITCDQYMYGIQPVLILVCEREAEQYTLFWKGKRIGKGTHRMSWIFEHIYQEYYTWLV
jgi:hypothetical protein